LTGALTKDIGLLHRITHAMMGLNRRPRNENIVLRDELDLLRDLTGFRLRKIGGVLRIECSDELAVTTDSALLLHILVNLVNNAVDVLTPLKEGKSDFTPALTIQAKALEAGTGSSAKEEPSTAIQISDNGPGVDPEVAERIFEIGYTTKRSGHGLGLPISRLIAGFLGGKLELAEQSKSQGATFQLLLPVSAPAIEDLERELDTTIDG